MDNPNFYQMGLDDRLLKAIANLKWQNPTPIQEKVIPLALEGKDVLVRAKTGSGKTGAFAIPLIQKLLTLKTSVETQEIRAVILAPSKELCKQIYNNIKDLTSCCSRTIKCVDISSGNDITTQIPLLMENPDIVVSTPARIVAHLKTNNVSLKNSLHILVIDEADLTLSFGCKNDINDFLKYLPKIFQTIMTSATLNNEVAYLKKHILHNPIVLQLDESDLPETSQLSQYYLFAEEIDKFVIICAFFKLSLIHGKTLIFTNSVERAFKVSLFLEQFGVNNCILNSDLPLESRLHVLNAFNEGRYNIIIASDDKHLEGTTKKKAKIKTDAEYSVSRGIDFRYISNVINFDFPENVNSYIHRVGRTARGTNQGFAISLINVKEKPLFTEVEKVFSKSEDDPDSSIFKKYKIKMEDLEALRYRTMDAYKAVTRVAIREARQKELQRACLTSEKIKATLEDNPVDIKVLQHDKALHIVKPQVHLRNIPDYIVPQALRNTIRNKVKPANISNYPPLLNKSKKIKKKHKGYNKKKDPLKNVKRGK